MRNMLLMPLKKLSAKFKRKDFIGFDIETRYNNKVMVMATMSFSDGTFKTFDTKEGFIKEMMKRCYKGKIWVASFMEFDAMGIFRGTEYEYKITPFMRGAFIFMMKTYVEDGRLVRHPEKPHDKKSYWPIIMQDTMSYAPISVSSLGKIIGVPKISHPGCFNRMPKDMIEYAQLEDYCKNDSLISRKSMEFFFDSFIKLGIKPRLTIASTSMDDMRRNHMKIPFKRMPDEDIEFCSSGYFGAMNGVYKRGMYDSVSNSGRPLFYHDVNNMYGSVMVTTDFPHPNYMRRDTGVDLVYFIAYIIGLGKWLEWNMKRLMKHIRRNKNADAARK